MINNSIGENKLKKLFEEVQLFEEVDEIIKQMAIKHDGDAEKIINAVHRAINKGKEGHYKADKYWVRDQVSRVLGENVNFISHGGPKQLWAWEVELANHDWAYFEAYGTWQEAIRKLSTKYPDAIAYEERDPE